jgi:hypothetical protein
MKIKRWECVAVVVALVALCSQAHGQAPAGSSFEQLSSQLKSGSAPKRQAAAVWLGQMGDMRAVAPLIQALERDQEADVRVAAAKALGMLRARGAITALQRSARHDPIRSVRDASNAALVQVGDVPALAGDAAAGKRRYAPDPERNPDYRAARSRRLAGILVTSVGGGVGALVGLLGLASYVDCQDNPYRYASDCDGSLATAIVGGVVLSASLAVGIPLWIGGKRRMEAIEKGEPMTLVPQVNVAVTDRQGHVTFRWRF